ncbi:MAG: chloride channel protein [Bacteroidales bacterium]|nr:chloride channel protein [Bacteroidales bacterium]
MAGGIEKWLKHNPLGSLSERNRVLLLSLLVGVCSGLAAVVLLKLIDGIRCLAGLLSGGSAYEWQNLVTPGIGMLLSLLLVRYVVRDNISHGVTKVLTAISKNESRIKPHNMWSSLLTSSITIGMGGSVGAEAPIVYTGAAIGSNFARFFGMSYKNMTVLLGCGAAGAVAGIFKAPLAGVLFTLEVLLFNMSMSSMVPLLLSSVSAAVMSYLFLGDSFPFQCTLTPFSMANIPFYVLLGLFGGLCSVYFLRTTLWLEDRVARIRRTGLRWGLCALGLGLLIFLFPQFYGEGYGSLAVLLNGGDIASDTHTVLGFLLRIPWGVPFFFLLVMLLKVFAMALTNAGGGVGGTFGPTLFVGAIAGFLVARTLNLLLQQSGISVPEQNFVLVGMAALMAGVMLAPLTAIFLIAEISGGYDLFLPLIIASTISFGTTRLFEKYSIYSKRIAQTGELLTHDNDQAVLTLMKTSDLIRDKYPRVKAEATLREILPVIAGGSAAVFPVVDGQDRFQGLLDMDNIRKIIFRTDLYDSLHVYNLMEQPKAFIREEEPMDSVMRKFEVTEAWRLPVVTADQRYLGFISKSRMLSAYREELKLISQD